MKISDWHTRYTLQALWTHDLRRYLCEKARLREARSVLEVGCGTGAVLAGLPEFTSAALHGLDIDFPVLQFAKTLTPAALTQGNAFHLPYPSASFDAVCCHYLLLWLANPVPALQEMRRVLHPGGSLLAFAEPDYGGRIDYPDELVVLGQWQSESLRGQGADPHAGRKLAGWLHAAGFDQVVTGLMGGEWSSEINQAEFDSEWDILRSDVGRTFSPPAQGDRAKARPTLDELQAIDKNARLSGERVLFVPTFYGFGRRQL